MILTLESTLKTVFSIYAAFWVTVVVGLFFAVGALMKRAERSLAKRGEHGGGAQH